MSTTLTIELLVHFQRNGKGNRKELCVGTEPLTLATAR